MDDYSYVQEAVFVIESHARKVLKNMSREDLWLLALLANPMLIEGWQVGTKHDLIEEITNALGAQFNIYDISKVLQRDRLCNSILDTADALGGRA